MDASTTDLFINLIQNHPVVYDKSLKEFKNTRKKDEAWASIAKQSRMNVDDAKKRYFSLRQKYCREKRSLEVKRRNKVVNRRNWVYYDRLHFLDAFIQPRATFTNDTNFTEGYDEETLDVNGHEKYDEGSVSESLNVDIQIDESVDVDGLNRFLEGNQVSAEPNTSQIAEDSNNFVEEVVSKYTGELSQIYYLSARDENDPRDDNDEDAVDNTQPIQTDVDQFQASDNFGPNYVSPYPSTSSVNNNIANIQSSNQPTASAALSVSRKCISSATRREMPTAMNVNSISTDISSERQRNRLTRPASNNASFVRPNPPSSSTDTRAPPTSTATSNEKQIEMIRRKMDSCLNAMQNKITDKAQRSPHAPFLAYLGTKLVNVPNEIISRVEEEIQEMVKYYSRQS